MAQITGKELADLNESALSDQRERAERASIRRMREVAIADADMAAVEALAAGDTEDAAYWADEAQRLRAFLEGDA